MALPSPWTESQALSDGWPRCDLMSSKLVAITDSVFPKFDPVRQVLAKIDAELRLANETTPEAQSKVL
jgi:hypothetical protein